MCSFTFKSLLRSHAGLSQSSSVNGNRQSKQNKHAWVNRQNVILQSCESCVNCVLIGIEAQLLDLHIMASLINVWILPPTVNDENDINNQLGSDQLRGRRVATINKIFFSFGSFFFFFKMREKPRLSRNNEQFGCIYLGPFFHESLKVRLFWRTSAEILELQSFTPSTCVSLPLCDRLKCLEQPGQTPPVSCREHSNLFWQESESNAVKGT